jgi:hypothetical protein
MSASLLAAMVGAVSWPDDDRRPHS